jgi:uncharacterized protein (TIGR00299 family) protein
MTLLYYDCRAGISGDMHLGALIDLGVAPERLRAELSTLPLGGWRLHAAPTRRQGIAATCAEIVVDHHDQRHRRLREILGLIDGAALSPGVKTRASTVFRRLAEAEGQVHGLDPERVHFHEVGAVDAIVDICGGVIGLELLGIDRIIASPVELGSGVVDCAHGRLPVPAPATEALLAGIPTLRGGQPFEATTPTGAALLATLADGFDPAPALTVRRIGHGAGRRDGPLPNLLRLLLCDPQDPQAPDDPLVELACNVDDMSPELFGPVMDRLLEQGANDCWLTPVIMKKGRPGILIGVLCRAALADTLTQTLLAETTSIGVRRHPVGRTALPRAIRRLDTPLGQVQVKLVRPPGQPLRAKPEHDDCLRLARMHGLPLPTVQFQIQQHLERALAAWDDLP